MGLHHIATADDDRISFNEWFYYTFTPVEAEIQAVPLILMKYDVACL